MPQTQHIPTDSLPPNGESPRRPENPTTINGLAIANAIHSEYFKSRYEKQPHEESVEMVRENLHLLREQVGRYLALHEAYVSPQCEHPVALDIGYLESIDLEILFAFQPFLLKRYQDPNQGSSQFIRVAQHSLSVCLWGDDWKDLADLPSDQFRRWVQIQNGESVDPPRDDFSF